MFKNPTIASAPAKSAQTVPAARRNGPSPSLSLASRHETLVIRLTALHKDVTTLATRRGRQALPDTVRILAEGLMADCAPFREPRDRLPVAAPDLSGLCVQLGQVLAQLENYERCHTFWNAGENCWCWRLDGATTPVKRLKPQLMQTSAAAQGNSGLRDKFTRMILVNRNQAYERGFEAGRAARIGPPVPPGFAEPDASADNNPRLADLD